MRLTPFREPARLPFHLSEGYTRVTLERDSPDEVRAVLRSIRVEGR